jgi:8-oxo-dGTP pyrophosphatase MutT (NUDIX family)
MGDAKVRHAAVLIPFMYRSTGVSVLFTERRADLRRHGGEVSFPGGTVSPTDRSLTETALREFGEEVGIEPRQVTVVGTLPSRSTRTGFQVLPVIGVVTPIGPLQPQLDEVASCFEVPVGYLLSSENYSRRPMPAYSRDRVFNVVEYDRYTIWGATATMLVDLRDRLADPRF